MSTKRFMQIFVGCFVIAASFLGFVIEAKAQMLATSAEEIFGTWVAGSSHYLRFDQDGTFRGANTLDQLNSLPYSINSYQFNGTKMVITEVWGAIPANTCGEKIASYEIQLLESGNIRIVVIEDQCQRRAANIPGEYKPVR
ncbi:MAG: hypothetical protein ABSB22_26700 [Thermodesulfobacteriota bacterium]|jgi:hypothetical protein